MDSVAARKAFWQSSHLMHFSAASQDPRKRPVTSHASHVSINTRDFESRTHARTHAQPHHVTTQFSDSTSDCLDYKYKHCSVLCLPGVKPTDCDRVVSTVVSHTSACMQVTEHVHILATCIQAC